MTKLQIGSMQKTYYVNIKEMQNLVDQYMKSGNLVSDSGRNSKSSKFYLRLFETAGCNNIYQKFLI